MGSPEVVSQSLSIESRPRLDEWVATNGPLWPPDALVIALQVCAQASRLEATTLAAVVDSLNAAGIVRQSDGWSWVQVPATASRTAADGEVIARIGALLFFLLTGQAPAFRFDSEHALKSNLRVLRPELSATLVDLVAGALMPGHDSDRSLAGFAQDVRHALGLARHTGRRTRRALTALMLVGTTAVVAWFAWMYWASGRDAPGPHGLTSTETSVLDIASETAHTMALVDEHTATLGIYQQIGNLWTARVALDDPRLAWNQMHEAWVRTLAGDRLTAEQILEKTPATLTRQLGETHPYTRTARLALADTLAARGETTQADALRNQARVALEKLFSSAGGRVLEFDRAPVPPGVIAHVAPNSPFPEGFRSAADGGFYTPLTSAERWISGTHGWRLHLTARGPCQTSFVAGAEPRLVAVHTIRSTDGGWQVDVGRSSKMTLVAPASETLRVTLAVTSTGALTIQAGDTHARATTLVAASTKAVPPYVFAFSDATNCEVVWLEIPFPPKATFAASKP